MLLRFCIERLSIGLETESTGLLYLTPEQPMQILVSSKAHPCRAPHERCTVTMQGYTHLLCMRNRFRNERLTISIDLERE